MMGADLMPKSNTAKDHWGLTAVELFIVQEGSRVETAGHQEELTSTQETTWSPLCLRLQPPSYHCEGR